MRVFLKFLTFILKTITAAGIVVVGSVIIVSLFILMILVFTFNQLPKDDLIRLTRIVH